jgi:hypothetical protein
VDGPDRPWLAWFDGAVRPRRALPPVIRGDVEGFASERSRQRGPGANWREVDAYQIDLASETRPKPALRRAGQTGLTENVEGATGQLASGRWWSRRSVEGLSGARWLGDEIGMA